MLPMQVMRGKCVQSGLHERQADMKKAIALGALLAVVLVFAMVGAANADTSSKYLGTGSPSSTNGSVIATVSINPMITLTIATPDVGQKVNWGAIDPGSAAAPKAVVLTVESNKAYTMTATEPGTDSILGAGLNFGRAPAPGVGWGTLGTHTFTDNYSLNPDFTVVPGNYFGTITYTVTQ
jgi:hypothetical protein